MNKLSVVITAYNEEKNIEDCLKSVGGLADEIIVVDNSSTDKTAEIARKFTRKVYHQKNDPTKIDLQKNFGFSKATCDWILSLDADERVTPELAGEIESRITNQESRIMGFEIPRKNIIFGRWIEHTGWHPDYQLRLFRKEKGRFVHKKVHEPLIVDGEVEKLKSPLHHDNYTSVNLFLSRMIVYTESEATALMESGYKFTTSDILKMPFQEFLRRFFQHAGYKDGLHGLSLSLLMAFYHLVIVLKIWEKNRFQETDKNMLDTFGREAKVMRRELSHWISDVKTKETKNLIHRTILKISQKI